MNLVLTVKSINEFRYIETVKRAQQSVVVDSLFQNRYTPDVYKNPLHVFK